MKTSTPLDELRSRKDSAIATGDEILEARVTEALVEYFAALDRGETPPRNALLEEYEDVADELVACLDGLDFIHSVAPQLAQPEAQDTAATQPLIRPLATLGDFRIVREIGRGGMGVVYEADQISLGRRVALKVLPFAAMLNPAQLNRFKNEARAAATLSHPHIVAVHCVGSERGVHYYAMQLVEGQSMATMIHELRHGAQQHPAGETNLSDRRTTYNLADRDAHCAASRPQNAYAGKAHPDAAAEVTEEEPQADRSTRVSKTGATFFRQAAEFGIQLADALDYAHQQGMIHRDIKPANILIDAAGKASITDFGLARLEDDAGMTMTGDVVGTLAYMSPEQAFGKRTVDHRADIYSLGATLYELVTLQPAFRGTDRQKLIHRIADSEPPAPRRINPAIPVDLETILGKAMRKEPAERYETAQALAADLQRFLEHKAILAQPPTWLERLHKWSYRNPAIVVSSIAVMGIAMIAFALATFFISRAYEDQIELRQVAEKAADEADLQQKRAERLLAISELERGIHLLNESDSYGLLNLLEAFTASRHHKNLHESVAYLSAVSHQFYANQLLEILPGGHIMEMSPNGQLLLISDTNFLSLWDTNDFQPHNQPVKLPKGIHAARFSPDGRFFAANSMYGVSRVWETATGRPVTPNLWAKSKDYEPIGGWPPELKYSLAFSPSCDLLAVSAWDGAAQLWEISSGCPVGQPLRHNCPGFLTLAFSPDRKWLATTGVDGMARLWDASTGLPGPFEWKHGGHGGWPKVMFSPDSTLICIYGCGNLITCDMGTGEQLYEIEVGWVQDFAFSPDGMLLATASVDKIVKLWNARSGELLFHPMIHSGRAWDIMFNSTGRLLASISSDGAAYLWDTTSGRLFGTPLRHQQRVDRVAISPDDRLLVTAGGDRTEKNTRIWRLGKKSTDPLIRWGNESHSHLSNSRPSGDIVFSRESKWSHESWCVTLSPDLSLAATGMDNGMVVLWNTTTGFPYGRPLINTDTVLSLAFSPDGRLLAAGYEGKYVRIWDIESGQPLGQDISLNANSCSLAFSPDGEQLAIGTWGWFAEIRDIQSRRCIHRFDIDDWCWDVAFNSNGTLLATASRSGMVQQWNLTTNLPYGLPLRHTDPVANIAYQQDGRLLATVSLDRQYQVYVNLWNVEHEIPHYGLQLPISPARLLLMFTQDGDLVTSGPESDTAQIWHLPKSIPSLREMELLTWISLGARLDPNGEVVAIPVDEWQSLSDELRLLW